MRPPPQEKAEPRDAPGHHEDGQLPKEVCDSIIVGERLRVPRRLHTASPIPEAEVDDL